MHGGSIRETPLTDDVSPSNGSSPCADSQGRLMVIVAVAGVRAIPLRDSLYTDNLILFISPSARDLQRTRSILSMFEDASGLACNLDKCQMAPIGCEEEHLVVAADEFPCQIAFPMKYLGIPLSATKLPRSAL
jgi:hypothetical protein